MLLYPVVLQSKAERPIAVLYVPVVLEFKARYPIAVLFDPVVLEHKALLPIAVLLCSPFYLFFLKKKMLMIFVGFKEDFADSVAASRCRSIGVTG